MIVPCKFTPSEKKGSVQDSVFHSILRHKPICPCNLVKRVLGDNSYISTYSAKKKDTFTGVLISESVPFKTNLNHLTMELLKYTYKNTGDKEENDVYYTGFR